VVAVLDVGKTNKKVSLYSREFEVLAEERTTIGTREYNGLEVEDTQEILRWFLEALKKLASKYEICAIAITTHGATFALLDEHGYLAHPVISYTSERGVEVQAEFYEVFGSRTKLHRETCTADIGFCNMAKVLYFVKTRLPETWATCRYGLFYGPYFAYELTANMGLEPTYVGNHTYFWDFAQKTWSSVARNLGADGLFGNKMSSPWDSAGTVKCDLAREYALPPDCEVTFGIHDSNANFLPYRAKGYDDFLLNSTGTWCVLMRNSEKVTLTDEEIEAKVFFNQDALGRPVRTSLITLGMDYDTFSGFTDVKDMSDADVLKQVVESRDLFVVPGVLPDATAFPGATPRVVHGERTYTLDALQKEAGTLMTDLGQRYFAALNLGLAIATARMLARCGIGKGTTVFIEGGFAKNSAYCAALAALCPEQMFALTSMKEGTSLGAALTGWMAATNCSLEDVGKKFTIETTPIASQDLGNLEPYRTAFNDLASAYHDP
jgi:L-fuculokinase